MRDFFWLTVKRYSLSTKGGSQRHLYLEEDGQHSSAVRKQSGLILVLNLFSLLPVQDPKPNK